MSSSSSPPSSVSDAWIDFVAGWCSGAAAIAACQPVDTVLTRWQAAGVVVSAASASSSRPPGSESALLMLPASTRTWLRAAGFRALWRGGSPMVAAVPLQNALLMGGYGVGLKVAGETDAEQRAKLGAVFVGGCTGGVLQSFLMSPVELVKVSQQTVGTKLRAALPSLHHPWRGLGATLLRDGIPHGVWFVSYEACKDVMMAGNGTDAESSVQVPLVSGAVAATVAWAVGYPADLIKTRVQASQTPLTIRQTAAQLIEESNGRVIPSLYRGFGMKLVRAIPASMIGFTVYEMVKKEIEQRL